MEFSEIPTWFSEIGNGLDGASLYLAIFSAAFLDSFLFTGLIVYGIALFGTGFYLLSNGLVEIHEIAAFAFLGAIVSDQLSYFLGKIVKDKIFHIWPLNKCSVTSKEKGYNLIEKYGCWGILLGRFTAPLRPLTPVISAILGMTYKKFLIADLLSCFVWVMTWSAVLFFII
ncbi:MAG: DedA family protein [Candidatus Pacebacteria bacterium]|nr:DedA family protein [Candidatus Paceibacterota bacterium]